MELAPRVRGGDLNFCLFTNYGTAVPLWAVLFSISKMIKILLIPFCQYFDCFQLIDEPALDFAK